MSRTPRTDAIANEAGRQGTVRNVLDVFERIVKLCRELEEELSDTNAAVSAHETGRQELKNTLQQLEGDVRYLERNIKEEHAQNKQLNAQNQRLDAANGKLAVEVTRLNAELISAKDACNQEFKRAVRWQDEAIKTNADNKMQRDQIEMLEGRISGWHAELERMDARCITASQRADRWRQDAEEILRDWTEIARVDVVTGHSIRWKQRLWSLVPGHEPLPAMCMPEEKPPQVVRERPMATHYRHLKTDRAYRIIGEGYIEATKQPVVIYEGALNIWWVRPEHEFFDGRFRAEREPQPMGGRSPFSYR